MAGIPRDGKGAGPIPVDVARRIALAAQGFANPRPSGRVDARHIRGMIDQVGVIQLDPVNVVCRSHYLPLFARLGAYPRRSLDRMAWSSRRELFEFFWHNRTSLLPLRTYPAMRARMQESARIVWDPASTSPDRASPAQASGALGEGMTRLATERPGLVEDVLAVVAEHGPISARDLSPDGARYRGPSGEGGRMWNWHDSKIVLEWLFVSGRVTVASRRGFERLYDLTERVIPADVLAMPAPDVEERQREVVRIAARALGVATARELCGGPGGYHYLPRPQAKARVAELVEAGDLIPVRIETLPQQAYLWPGAAAPRRVEARALLSPFDSMIWSRARIERLFGFRYRISIYTPAAQRTDGYYVLPFLLGDELVARVDLKADRDRSTLCVPVANVEPRMRDRNHQIAAELAEELRVMASWLELDRVEVGEQGDLAPVLSRAAVQRR